MPLSTHPKVWGSLLLITFCLTLVMGVCLYFSDIFITMLVGLALIVLADRFYSNSLRRLGAHFSSRTAQHIYLAGLIFFWVVALGMLFGHSLSDLNAALKQTRPAEANIDGIYLARIAPLLPDWLAEKVLTPERIKQVQDDVVPWLSAALTNMVVCTAYGALLIPVMFFTYYRRRAIIAETIDRAIPERFRHRQARISGEIGRNLASYFSARVIESMLVGAICCLGFFVAGVKGWLILGLLAGILNIADYVGPLLSIIPPVVISLLLNDTLAAGLSVLIIIFAQLVDNFFLIPVMISDKVNVDPLMTVLLILVGGSLLGMVGIIFAIPVYLIYRVVLRESYSELIKIYPDAPSPASATVEAE